VHMKESQNIDKEIVPVVGVCCLGDPVFPIQPGNWLRWLRNFMGCRRLQANPLNKDKGTSC
jgi:hypothetical protein